MPKTYTQPQREAAITAVIAGLRAGTPLTVICSADGMPNDDTIRDWAEADGALGRAIARARKVGFDMIALDALKIIDAEPERVVTMSGDDRSESRIDGGSVQHAKNRAEMRLKLLSKWDPKGYGDKLELSGDADNPLKIVVNKP